MIFTNDTSPNLEMPSNIIDKYLPLISSFIKDFSCSRTNGTSWSMWDGSVNRIEFSSRISLKYFNLEMGTPALIKDIRTLIRYTL